VYLVGFFYLNGANAMVDPDAIVGYFADWDLTAVERDYLALHRERYAFLAAVVDPFVREATARTGAPTRILDVGAHFQTEMFRRMYPDALVNTLGFAHDLVTPRSGELHFEVDLNDVLEPARCPEPEPHDIVVMAEVIEHLYTSPVTVLRYIARWLEVDGKLLIQTPNAVSLNRRIRLLTGRNPYEMIRESRVNPGHFHEYTVSELRDVARDIGLEVESASLHNYFASETNRAAVNDLLSRVLPPSFRRGITMCLSKRKS
jgi:Methyltransferase domain